MSITYDEVWISTMREIKICKDYIEKYEKELKTLEDELKVRATELSEDMLKDSKIRKLYEIKHALERERERLKGLEELLR